MLHLNTNDNWHRHLKNSIPLKDYKSQKCVHAMCVDYA